MDDLGLVAGPERLVVAVNPHHVEPGTVLRLPEGTWAAISGPGKFEYHIRVGAVRDCPRGYLLTGDHLKPNGQLLGHALVWVADLDNIPDVAGVVQPAGNVAVLVDRRPINGGPAVRLQHNRWAEP